MSEQRYSPSEIYPWDDWEHHLPALSAAETQRDYSASAAFKSDVALYLPAISETFVKALEGRRELLCGRFAASDLQFTNPETQLFFYPWVLYSAGQAASSPGKAVTTDWLTKKPRDSRVVVVGDSGGFQIQQGTIDFTPETTTRMLKWLERVADHSMILDFPTGGISSGALTEHIFRLKAQGNDVETEARKHGFAVDYMACLIQTEINNKHFAAHRASKATCFLNVIQGRNEAESAFWYSRMKTFDFEGWAFAGFHHTQISMTLRRLVEMHRDGKLYGCKWIHFLGISTLKAGIVLSLIQRALHETGMAPDVQISFDSASPVKAAARGYQAVLGFDMGKDRWSFSPKSITATSPDIQNKTLSQYAGAWARQDSNRIPVSTFVGDEMKISELLTERPGNRPTINADQLALLMHHNTQAYIEGFRRAYVYLHDSAVTERPASLSHMDLLITAALKADKSIDFINEIQPQLDALMLEKV